jgi:hypothetical protein
MYYQIIGLKFNMEKIYSKVEEGKLLHIINRLSEIEGRTEAVPEDNFIQCATLKMEKGKTFPPHKHITKDRHYEAQIAQESWVVIEGKVLATLFDIDNSKLAEIELDAGSCMIFFNGGHSLRALEDNTFFYEFKNGPYYGFDKDKCNI